MDFRRLGGLLIGAVMMSAAVAAPDVYPVRAVRIINPFPPGSPVDIVARLAAQRLQEAWRQSVVVDNRGGAGGTIGAEAVARAAADGYTLLVTSSSTQVIAPALRRSLPYDATKDFTPIALLAYGPTAIVVNPSVPVHTLKEFVDYCKSNPGKVSYASSGPGTILHLTGELFAASTGTSLIHIPYKGAVPASTDLIGGQVQAMFDSISNSAPQVKAGRLRALAVLTPARSPLMPDVPTAAEAGFTGLDFPSWIGLFGPANVPPEVVARTLAALRESMTDPATTKLMVDSGLVPAMKTEAEFARIIEANQKVVADLVKTAHIPLQ
jgi:tripartite-type tricarboxylate transporter receptor subunit TctC